MEAKYYYKDGTTSSEELPKILHREDGPAVSILYNHKGVRYWYMEGGLHRVDGPAIEYGDESKEWWVGGDRHRVDGPAIKNVNGTNEWYIEGKRHRIDGPAVDYKDGPKHWFVDDIEYTEEQFNILIRDARILPLALRLTDPREWIRKIS